MKPKGDDGHDDEGLGIGPERDGKQCENHDQGNREPAIQRVQGLELLLLFASERVGQVRVHVGQVREDRILQDAVGFVSGNH